MLVFLCLLRTDGAPVSDAERMTYASRINDLAGSGVNLLDAGEFVAFVAPVLVPHRPLRANRLGLLGIGNVRLDHRDEVRRWSGAPASAASDLELVLDAVNARGTRCLRDVLGDFAVVIWHPPTRTLTAARDAFGVKTLFTAERGPLLVLSSHLELVHDDDRLDEDYVADFLLAGDPGPVRTIWADSRAVAQGSIVTSRYGRSTSERYWDPLDFVPTPSGDPRTQVEQFRTLFREAVRTRMDPDGPTWAELSGGLDSSSVVSTAQALAQEGVLANGIAGTLSIVDELGAGDERRFSKLVVERFGLPNAVVVNPWPWQNDGQPPPRTDEPRMHYPLYARDRRICDMVRDAGARVLLSGTGSDHYLYGNRLYISDMISTGQSARAVAELVRWSVLEKRSFWTSLTRDGVLPLLPVAARMPFQEPWLRVPDWIEPRFAERLAMTSRVPATKMFRAPRGKRFAWNVADAMQELVRWLPRGPFEERLEVRYPFLYRPLVELGLRLPAQLRIQPLAPKWILREAMRGILPEPVRMRSGKGAIDARLIWSLNQEHERITALVSDSALHRLGILRRDKLRAAVERGVRGEMHSVVMLMTALSLETWLSARSGAHPTDTTAERANTNIEISTR